MPHTVLGSCTPMQIGLSRSIDLDVLSSTKKCARHSFQLPFSTEHCTRHLGCFRFFQPPDTRQSTALVLISSQQTTPPKSGGDI